MMEIFGKKKPVIGMIHVNALPGTPKQKGRFQTVINKAVEEARIYKNCGADIIAIENMHDVPYLKREVGPEITAAMTVIGYEVKNVSGLPVGIQILAGANKEALAAAHSAGLDFIRAEGFVFAHVADEGIMESDAGELLRYRKMIGAESVKIFTDIKKKHSSHAVTGDVDIAETAKAAEFFLSDGVIITGVATGTEADVEEIIKVKKSVKIPVLIGSGITDENIEKYYPIADAFIVGSYFKFKGNWKNGVDEKRVKAFMKKIRNNQN
ncbi:MAG: BtpA/SgcQ family protein [Chlorobi bacterium]|nr:BtpA/SgcQ family protein [Chlorobiota bacterium]